MFIIVQAIAHHEVVGNFEADEIDVKIDQAKTEIVLDRDKIASMGLRRPARLAG